MSLSLDVVPVFCGEPVTLRYGSDAFDVPPIGVTPEADLKMSAGNAQVQRAWDRAVSDLASLALLEGEGDERRTPAAGIPKYLALFGRDVLMTAFQASFPAPAMMRGSLGLIAKWNATKYDERYDEEPGRVIHQRQLEPVGAPRKEPLSPLLRRLLRSRIVSDRPRLGSGADRRQAIFSVDARQGARRPSSGWIATATATATVFTNTRPRLDRGARRTRAGRIRRDAILYEDGRMVENPIAVVEVQGCYYAAKQLLGLAFASLGEERRAAELLAQAERLKRRFNETFWMPEHQYFALALDPDKNLVRSIAADPGQCLAYGIIDDDKAEAVAARLMMPDLFSGWGIRTLSSGHPAFNPFAIPSRLGVARLQ